jgi:hypothetical protein
MTRQKVNFLRLTPAESHHGTLSDQEEAREGHTFNQQAQTSFRGVMEAEASGWERSQTELLSKHSVLGSHRRAGPTGWPSRL